MNNILGIVLRSGVVLSGVIIATGTGLFIANHSLDDTTSYLAYNPSVVPHGNLATPVTRVALSLFLFAAERDRKFVYLTAAVLAILLFSILATPLIPLFNS